MAGLFVKKIEGAARLYELTVPQADGRSAFYKLSIDPLKEALFNKACKDGVTVDLTNYGTILDSYYLPKAMKFKAVTETVN